MPSTTPTTSTVPSGCRSSRSQDGDRAIGPVEMAANRAHSGRRYHVPLMQTLIDFILHIDAHPLDLASATAVALRSCSPLCSPRPASWSRRSCPATRRCSRRARWRRRRPDRRADPAHRARERPAPGGRDPGDAVNYADRHASARACSPPSDESGLLQKPLNRRHLAPHVFSSGTAARPWSRPVRADRAHVRALRGRRRRDDPFDLRSTTSRARSSGSGCASRSATCRHVPIQEELLAGDARHHLRLGAAGRLRGRQASPGGGK